MHPRSILGPRTFIVVLAFAAAPAIAFAQPSPATSVVPAAIRIVGFRNTLTGVPDASESFTVTVNDAGGGAIVGAEVVLDFAACTDMCLCSYPVPGQTIACDPVTCRGTVSAITVAGGVATFQVLGAGLLAPVVPPAMFPGPGAGCIAVSAGPPGGPYVALGATTCVHLDLQGGRPGGAGNGLNGEDMAFLIQDIGAFSAGAGYRGRSDWNMDGRLNAVDLVHFFVGLGRAAQGLGSAGGCSIGGVIDYCP